MQNIWKLIIVEESIYVGLELMGGEPVYIGLGTQQLAQTGAS